jgi:hypothetical protein
MLPNPTEKGHLFFPYPACTEQADKELLPAYHEVSVYPKKEFPIWTLFASMFSCRFLGWEGNIVCNYNPSSVAIFAILFHQYPEETVQFIQTVRIIQSLIFTIYFPTLKLAKSAWSSLFAIWDYFCTLVPENLMSLIASTTTTPSSPATASAGPPPMPASAPAPH